jgi:hypothetical protein
MVWYNMVLHGMAWYDVTGYTTRTAGQQKIARTRTAGAGAGAGPGPGPGKGKE